MSAPPVERTHTGLGLRLLYTLERRLPPLRVVPRAARRAARRALTAAAVRESLRRCERTRLVAVTGSAGKTTTKDLLGAMLATAGPTMVTRSNDNDVYGLPATLLLVRPRDRFGVIEVGAKEPGDVPWMASLFSPELVVLTGIGTDHLRSLGTIEAVMREKHSLLARLAPDGTAVVNADDERALEIAGRLDCRVVTAGHSDDADVRVEAAGLDWPTGMEVRLAIGGESHVARTRLLGEHRATQVALALAAAVTLGVPVGDALAAAATVPSRPGRLHLAEGPAGSRLLLDDYKSRPSTVTAALLTLREAPARRRIAVLGECQEVDHTPAYYAPIAAAARETVDTVVAIGRSAAPLRAGLGDGVELLEAQRPSEAAALLVPRLQEGDLVLVSGAARQHTIRVAMRLRGEPVGCDVARCIFHWHCGDCPHLAAGPPGQIVEAP